MLRPETVEACWDQVEYRLLDNRVEAYADLLSELWATGEAFAIIEQDILIHQKVLPAWDKCRHRWCGFGYTVGPSDAAHGVYLGCTKFSKRLVRDIPDVLEEACQIDDDGLGKKDWHRMDVRVDRVLRSWGEVPVMHPGPVVHLHYQDADGSIFRQEPLESKHRNWRVNLPK